MDSDLDDTHLCIKCSQTITGLDNYIKHRKQNCSTRAGTHSTKAETKSLADVGTNTDRNRQHNLQYVDKAGSERFVIGMQPIITSTSTHNSIKLDHCPIQTQRNVWLSVGAEAKSLTTTGTNTRISSQTNANHTQGNEHVIQQQHNATTAQVHAPEVSVAALSYEPFSFNENEPPSTSSGGKTSKSLEKHCELPYELGADVFFSSLQLKSVQQVGSTSGGKITSTAEAGQLQRQKSLQQEPSDGTPHNVFVETWMGARSEIVGVTKKTYEPIYESIAFEPDSPAESEDEDEEGDMIDVDVDNDDDEDYDPLNDSHATGGKWKLPLMRHSPPVVPMSHTGGKWKPEHRPNLRVTHTQMSRLSPNWDDHIDDMDVADGQHPPADHTKGKWIPGTKLQRLEYKEVVELAKCSNQLSPNQDYWCNICSRKLKSKTIYENHLKTSYHIRRAEPEQQLEKAAIQELEREDINKSFCIENPRTIVDTEISDVGPKKRIRRSHYLKCKLCNRIMHRHLIGKHLISHYHYRHMQMHPASQSFHMILDHIHSVVLQSPFQCRPCRFYANTEETFLLHWNSAAHLDQSEGPGKFWCSYCRFECEDNNQMRRHLLGLEHKEVLLAINRSVPVCISKRLNIDCPKCGQTFRYNFQLKRHLLSYHNCSDFVGTTSDSYQSKFKCGFCPEVLSSKIALQRHEKYKHYVSKYFCSICSLEFNSPCKAKKHRKTMDHKLKSACGKSISSLYMKPHETKIKRTLMASMNKEKKSSSLPVLEPTLDDDEPSTSKAAQLKIMQSVKSHKATKQNVILKCLKCELNFNSKRQLEQHRTEQHQLSPQHKCMSCGDRFLTAQELGRHSRHCKPKLQEVSKKTNEEACSKQTADNKEHSKSFNCDLCPFEAPYESEIIYHGLFHSHGTLGKHQLIKCPLCEKSFRKHSLRCHLRLHTNEKIFKCEICLQMYASKHNLKDHITKQHSNKKIGDSKPKTNSEDTQAASSIAVKLERKLKSVADILYQCTVCHKEFKGKRSLIQHNVTQHQTDVLPKRFHFQCPQENCQYSSSSKISLKIHIKSHSLESFECSIKNCKYVGKSELHLKRHHKHTHTTVPSTKLLQCDKCNYKTKINSHLNRHQRSHTGEKPYPCPHCDFRCSSLENLRKHVLKTDKHPGKYVYECKLCEGNGNDTKTLKSEPDIYKTNSYQEYRQHLTSNHDESK